MEVPAPVLYIISNSFVLKPPANMEQLFLAIYTVVTLDITRALSCSMEMLTMSRCTHSLVSVTGGNLPPASTGPWPDMIASIDPKSFRPDTGIDQAWHSRYHA